jgi:hypothetical protein
VSGRLHGAAIARMIALTRPSAPAMLVLGRSHAIGSLTRCAMWRVGTIKAHARRLAILAGWRLPTTRARAGANEWTARALVAVAAHRHLPVCMPFTVSWLRWQNRHIREMRVARACGPISWGRRSAVNPLRLSGGIHMGRDWNGVASR